MFDLLLVFIIQTLDVTQPEKSKICFVWCLFTEHFCCTNRFPDIVTDKCVAFVHTTPPPPTTIRIVFTPHQKIEMIMKYNKHIKKITMIKHFIFGIPCNWRKAFLGSWKTKHPAMGYITTVIAMLYWKTTKTNQELKKCSRWPILAINQGLHCPLRAKSCL